MGRSYVSALRTEQYKATRVRIIEAVARVLARGVTELSVPAVADEAGVSVATVYRHFPTKQELVAGLREYSFEKLDVRPSDWTSGRFDSIEEVLEELPAFAARLVLIEPELRAAVASGVVDEFRREHRSERLKPIEVALRRERPDVKPEDLRRLRDVIAVLVSTPGVRAFEVLAGSSPEDAGVTIAWAVRRLLRDL